jgi:hypothetical protein
MTRCPFIDHNGLQCRATSEQPFTDGWAAMGGSGWPPGLPDGLYCPAHAEAIEQLVEAGELE